MRVLALGLGVLAISTTSACADAAGSQWRTFSANELSIRYPPGWHATQRPLTPVSDPPQVLAVASYALPQGPSGADGCQPKEALERLPADGVFIYGWEYSGDPSITGLRVQQFRPRPSRFALTRFAHYECLGPSYLLRFREAGRLFQVHVAFGERASAGARETALRVLDSLQVKQG